MARKAKPVKHERRKRGTGTVVKRKDGRWQYSYLHNGKRYTGYAASYEEADRLVLEAITEAEKHGFVSERMTVAEYLEEWMKTKQLRANTQDGWSRSIRNRIIPALGKIPLADLQRRDVQSMINSWTSEDLKPSSMRTYFAPLRIAIVEAIQAEIIAHNPCNYIKFPRIEEQDEEEEQQVLTIEQSQMLLSQLEGHWLRPMVLLALATGLRRGELLSLRWSDIDFQTGKLHVRRNVAQISGRGYIEDGPKTRSSRRTLTVPDFALAEIWQHRVQQNKIRLEVSDWQDLDLVFCRKDGTYIEKGTPGYFLDIALRKAGLSDIAFHDLRHSTGSILIALGIDMTTVSKILGHANTGITMRIYAHMLPGRDGDAMNRYNEAFGDKKAN